MRDSQAEAQLGKANRRVGEFIKALTEGRGATGVDEGVVTRITIRLPTRDEPEVLLVVKASGTQGDFVGFVGGLDVAQALLVWSAKDQTKGLKWRVDVPWAERSG